MSDQRKDGISWTDETWNPVRGCSKVSPGCKHCYAESVAARFCGEGLPYHGLIRDGHWSGDVRFVPEKLDAPLRWKRPRRVFVNSMSDLFHESLTNEQIAAVFGVMAACQQHTFQVLTKRAKRMAEWFEWLSDQRNDDGTFPLQTDLVDRHLETYLFGSRLHDSIEWPLPNVHLGVSCENQQAADDRIPLLLQCPAAVRWVSAEPLLGAIDFAGIKIPYAPSPPWRGHSLHSFRGFAAGLDWVVVGGESGPHARPMHPDWARSIRDQCKAAGVPFHFKQWGTWAPGYDEDKFTFGREETSSRAQPWLRDDGESGDCWVYDDDGTWQNYTGDPGEDMGRIATFHRHASKEAKAILGHLLDGREYRMWPGDHW